LNPQQVLHQMLVDGISHVMALAMVKSPLRQQAAQHPIHIYGATEQQPRTYPTFQRAHIPLPQQTPMDVQHHKQSH
jgi:hypothetical protein